MWAVESDQGLGYLLAQQLVAAGEVVLDVPAVRASRVRTLSSGRSQKNDPNDAGRSQSQRYARMILPRFASTTTHAFCGCW